METSALVKTAAIQIPVILASLALVVAALSRTGKEKGAIAILIGAIGLLVMSVANPIFYLVVFPKLIESRGAEAAGNLMMGANLVASLLWGAGIGLIAIGTFVRSKA